MEEKNVPDKLAGFECFGVALVRAMLGLDQQQALSRIRHWQNAGLIEEGEHRWQWRVVGK